MFQIPLVRFLLVQKRHLCSKGQKNKKNLRCATAGGKTGGPRTGPDAHGANAAEGSSETNNPLSYNTSAMQLSTVVLNNAS